jgi:type II secretory pathway pseudopilin PulG
MSEYTEKRTVVEDVPIKRARPVVETQYDSVVREQRGMSGGAITALVLAAIAAAVVITMLIMNNQQRNSDEELAQERARNAAAQQAQAQQPSQQPPVIVMPQSPSTVPVPAPSQPAPSTTATAPTSTELEIDINSKFLDDQDLRSYPIDVKVIGGTAMLSGHAPNNELRTRAEKLAKTVKGIRSVTNNIVVKPE